MPVYKGKNGTWYYSFKKKNAVGEWKNFKKRGFRTKREASAAEREAIGNTTATVSATFREMVQIWQDYNDTPVPSRTNQAQHLKYRFAKYADMPMSKLDKKAIMAYRAELANMPYATATKNQCVTFIRSVISFAHSFYGYEDNSAILSHFRETDEEVLNEFEVWTPSEFNSFVACVDNELYALYFTFLYWTGCRRGEGIALQKDCVGDHTVAIKYNQINQKDGLKPTKGRRKRIIKIDDILFSQLQPLLETAGNYVFGGEVGLSPSCIRDELKKGIKKSGVKEIRLHDFRHSHATWLINNGVNIVAISRRLGHKDISTTLKVYSHLLESTDNDMMKKINEYKKG